MPFIVNIVFLVVTAAIAVHAITYRDKQGHKDWIRLLFGCIALVFFLRVLLVDVLGII